MSEQPAPLSNERLQEIAKLVDVTDRPWTVALVRAIVPDLLAEVRRLKGVIAARDEQIEAYKAGEEAVQEMWAREPARQAMYEIFEKKEAQP